MKIQLKDYLQKVTFNVMEKKFPGNYGQIKDFDENNIMINIDDESLFPNLNKDSLTMVTVFNIFNYEELIYLLESYESNTLKENFNIENSMFKEKPKIFLENEDNIKSQKFVVLGGHIPGKRSYPKNNDMLTKRIICSEEFLKNKISFLDYDAILKELNKYANNCSLNENLVTGFNALRTRVNFKLILEYNTIEGVKYLSNIADYIELKEFEEEKIFKRNILTKNKKIINLNKYIVNK